MPPNMTVAVTLTSASDSADLRTINLTPGESTIIGRSSKSAGRNVQAAQSNALYECPVISRRHAELTAPNDTWSDGSAVVNVTDLHSLHGTRINGTRLIPNAPYPVRSGDVLQFGDRVTRGEDTHDGISVTFNLVDSSQTLQNKGFGPPSDSEELYSDAESVDSYEPDHPSSVQTTPEQVKIATLGSQEKPIDLDIMAEDSLHSVIDIGDDDDDDDDDYNAPAESFTRPSITMPPHTESPSRRTAHGFVKVADTYDLGESEQFSFDGNNETKPASNTRLDAQSSNAAEDADSVVGYNTGLTSILASPSSPLRRDDQDEESSKSYEFGFDEDNDDDDAAEILSASDASDLPRRPSPSPARSEVESEVDDDELLMAEEVAIANRVSQELRSDDVSVEQSGSFRSGSKHYDPVRGSQPPTPSFAKAHDDLGSKTYEYMPPPYMTSFASASRAWTAGRWDMPPAAHAQSQMPSNNYAHAPIDAAPSSQPSSLPFGVTRPFPRGVTDNYHPDGWYYDYSALVPYESLEASSGLHPKDHVMQGSRSSRIGISDIVEAPPCTSATNGAEADVGTASLDGAEALNPISRKRKANTMSSTEQGGSPPSSDMPMATGPTTAPAEQSLEPLDRPAPKKQKTASSCSRANKQWKVTKRLKRAGTHAARCGSAAARFGAVVAKYSTAAAVGAAGMFAFLSSPLAERMVTGLTST